MDSPHTLPHCDQNLPATLEQRLLLDEVGVASLASALLDAMRRTQQGHGHWKCVHACLEIAIKEHRKLLNNTIGEMNRATALSFLQEVARG